MKLSVYSPERKVFVSADCAEATLPTSEGEVQVLPGHAAFVGTLETGRFLFRMQDGSLVSGVVSSGFYEISGEKLTVIAETLEFPNEIDMARAKKAQIEAEKQLSGAMLEPHQFNKYQLKLQRALIRQQMAQNSSSMTN